MRISVCIVYGKVQLKAGNCRLCRRLAVLSPPPDKQVRQNAARNVALIIAFSDEDAA